MKSRVRKKSIHHPFGEVFAFAFAIILCVSFAGYSQSATELYSRANQLYKTKQFRQAADEYEKLIGQGYKNAEVYYNLGNCYYKME